MVNPIYIFIIALGVAFLLPVIDKASRKLSLTLFFAALAAMFSIGLQWCITLLQGTQTVHIFTAGVIPPYSINLQLGLEEALFIAAINLLAIFSAFYLMERFIRTKTYAMMLFLTLIMGINGMIMTRDLFNLFVFMEITAMATYSLIGITQSGRSLAAGFKYLIAGSLASVFILIGIIYIYRLTGTLNLDSIIASKAILQGQAGFFAVFMLLIAVLIELKPWPANGWALDVYESVDSGVAAIIAVAVSGGMFFVFYKIVPLFNPNWYVVISIMGLLTFIVSNLIGLKQTNAKRMLGYSSIAQMGLLISALTLIYQFQKPEDIFSSLIYVIVALFLNHFLAKAGLFWIAGIVKKENYKEWGLKKNPVLLLSFAVFIFALIGLPPFPGFWAKWHLITRLASNNLSSWIFPILLGSLLEAVYLLRWFGRAVKSDQQKVYKIESNKSLPIIFFVLSIIGFGLYISQHYSDFNYLFIAPLLAGTAIYSINWLPSRIKGFLSIAILAAFGLHIFPTLNKMQMLFEVIFLAGGAVQLLATMGKKENRPGFYTYVIMLLLSLGLLPIASSTLEFFFAWEMMSISSYLLIMRGKKAETPALRYIIFSLGGAYAILTGFAFAYAQTGLLGFTSMTNITNQAGLIYSLIVLGFLVKSGAIGLHVWLPGAYAEAEDDASPIISSILSKSGIYGLIIAAGIFGYQHFAGVEISNLLGWIGAITALIGAIMAVFQEDIKYLLAYSSMSQVGYMILSVAILSHLGWVSAIYLSFIHMMYKAILFIAVAGIVSRVGTTKMYQMGGLIKKMPLSFTAVLISIIAVSGVPPLAGFGGKWLLYSALIEKGWFLQTGVAFFASAAAFLYLFRLIHTIFLGQLKTRFQEIKEASLWFIIPQYIFIFAIMAISTYPNLILKPIMAAVEPYFGTSIQWEGYTAINSLGYWNGNAVMMVTMGVFMVPLIWLLVRVNMVRKVGQFNIVFAAERPDKPETTHVAYNFFGHYQKALGFLVRSYATSLWDNVSEWTHSLASAFRLIYTGNIQTYALHILLYTIILYNILGVK